jgi:2-dehydropantoate 2-reductase
MRASVGDILNARYGKEVLAGLFAECSAIAGANGRAPRPAFMERMQAMLAQQGSTLTASMLRDIERNGPTEADHIIGDLLARGRVRGPSSAFLLLQIAYAH